jgi:hypothetical protein
MNLANSPRVGRFALPAGRLARAGAQQAALSRRDVRDATNARRRRLQNTERRRDASATTAVSRTAQTPFGAAQGERVSVRPGSLRKLSGTGRDTVPLLFRRNSHKTNIPRSKEVGHIFEGRVTRNRLSEGGRSKQRPYDPAHCSRVTIRAFLIDSAAIRNASNAPEMNDMHFSNRHLSGGIETRSRRDAGATKATATPREKAPAFPTNFAGTARNRGKGGLYAGDGTEQGAGETPALRRQRRQRSSLFANRQFPVRATNRDPGARCSRNAGTLLTTHQSLLTTHAFTYLREISAMVRAPARRMVISSSSSRCCSTDWTPIQPPRARP